MNEGTRVVDLGAENDELRRRVQVLENQVAVLMAAVARPLHVVQPAFQPAQPPAPQPWGVPMFPGQVWCNAAPPDPPHEIRLGGC